MGQKLKNLEFQKLFQEYNFLSIDEEYKKEFILEKNNIFVDAVKKLISEEPHLNELINPNSEDKQENNLETTENIESNDLRLLLNPPEYKFNIVDWFINSEKGGDLVMYSDKFNENFIDEELINKKAKKEKDSKIKQKAKNIFRNIAKKTHPDKAGTNSFSDLYIKAKEALEDYDLYELYSICSRIGILYDVEEFEKEELKDKIKQKKEEISKIETAFVWVWIHTENEQEKKHILRVFLIQHGMRFKSFF